MGSKKDEKYRFLMLDEYCKVDLKEMKYNGIFDFLQEKSIQRQKNGAIEGGDVKIFYKLL